MDALAAEIERRDIAVSGCKLYLGMQKLFIQPAAQQPLPATASDRFSLGYLFGFVDAFMQASSVETEGLCLAATMDVFEDLFGVQGQACFTEAMSLMERRESGFVEGMMQGGEEALERIRAGMSGKRGFEATVPSRWAVHAKGSVS